MAVLATVVTDAAAAFQDDVGDRDALESQVRELRSRYRPEDFRHSDIKMSMLPDDMAVDVNASRDAASQPSQSQRAEIGRAGTHG